jgi:hypothetical protein
LSPDTRRKIRNLRNDISIYLAIHTLFIAEQNESEQILRYLSGKLKLKYGTKIE